MTPLVVSWLEGLHPLFDGIRPQLRLCFELLLEPSLAFLRKVTACKTKHTCCMDVHATATFRKLQKLLSPTLSFLLHPFPPSQLFAPIPIL